MSLIKTPDGISYEKIEIPLDITTIVSPKDILNYVRQSPFLNEKLNFTDPDNPDLKINYFQESLLDNIELIKVAWSKDILTKEEKLVMENLANIDKKAKDTVGWLIKELFKYYLPQYFDIEDFLKSLDEYGFLKANYYTRFSKSSRIWEKLAFDLYVLAANYYMSYYRYISYTSSYHNSLLKKLSTKEINEINNEFVLPLLRKMGEDYEKYEEVEKNYIYQILFIWWVELKNNNGEMVLESMLEHFSKMRIKDGKSVIKKILRSTKYVKQVYKMGVLPDTLGVTFSFNNIWEIEQIAEYYKTQKEKWGVVGKFHPRGLFWSWWDNKDTISDEAAFFNADLKGKVTINGKTIELSWWEQAFRKTPNEEIQNIFKQEIKKETWLIYELVKKVLFLNHGIYKLSQDIWLLRYFTIEKKVLAKRNLHSSIEEHLDEAIKKIIEEIKTPLEHIFLFQWKKLPVSYEAMLKIAVYQVLSEKLLVVINDLAWESVLDKIKQTSWYKRISSEEEKVKYLQRLSLKFIAKRENPNYRLGNYSEEIQKIFEEYKREYKRIYRTADFYKTVEKRLKRGEEMLKRILETNKNLVDIMW